MPATPENMVQKDKDKKEVSVAQGHCHVEKSDRWLSRHKSNVISYRFFSPLISGWLPFFRAQICSLLKLRTLPEQISMSNDSMDSQCDIVVGQNPPRSPNCFDENGTKTSQRKHTKTILYSIDSIDITLLVDGRTGCITIANWGDVSWEIPQREVHSRKSSVSARMCDSRLKHTSLQ